MLRGKWSAVRSIYTLCLLLFIFVLPSLAGAQSWYNTGWKYRQEIIINSTITDSDLTDFPVLIQITDSLNPLFARAQTYGDDILFTTADGETKLPHEIDYYTGASGSEELDAWVKVPTLSGSASSVIYMYYGNPSATNQENREDVWDADYQGVWHLNEVVNDEGISAKHYDSTSNNANGSRHGNNDDTGKISTAQRFDGLDDAVNWR